VREVEGQAEPVHEAPKPHLTLGNGWEVARKVHEDPTTAATRFIAVTGYASEEDRRRSQEAGFEGHLVKPVAVDELILLLTRKKVT
jgi:CheY-like chemotaxis protein